MRYYKDNNNNIFGYEENQIPNDGLIAITESEKDLILAPTEEELNKLHNENIYFQLEQIDKKKVRAITDLLISNDKTRLLQLEDEANLLRSQLK